MLEVRNMIFKEYTRWLSDKMPETTEAVVVVSDCGTVIKRLPYKKWNQKNKSYSNMKEMTYKQSSNRGKQRFESNEKKRTYGQYKHVEINGKVESVHRIVAKCFIENPLNKECVNHVNGIRDDNRVENLEWATNKENVRHAWKTGLRKVSSMKKLSDDNMPEISKLRASGLSNQAIGKLFGVTGETIRVRMNQYEDSFYTEE